MRFQDYDDDDPIPVAIFAQHPAIQRTKDCIVKWCRSGCVNRNTRLRVILESSFLPNGGLAVSVNQYQQFLQKLNEKP